MKYSAKRLATVTYAEVERVFGLSDTSVDLVSVILEEFADSIENREFGQALERETKRIAEKIKAGERPYTIATVSDIDTTGESLLITCKTKEETPRTFSFEFAKKDNVTSNDSRLCRELFKCDSIIVNDLSEEEEEEGAGQSMEEMEVSSFTSRVIEDKERYISSLLVTTDNPQNETVSPLSVYALKTGVKRGQTNDSSN